MKFLKKLLKSDTVQNVLVWVAAGYIKLCFKTARWETKGVETLSHYQRKNEPVIFCFWHGRMFMIPNFSHLANESYVMISRHGDGEFISRVMEYFNLKPIRGSTTHKGKERGGAAVIREAMNMLADGKNLAITPDGPRGPRMRVTGTIVEIAQMTGAPIIPATFSSSLCKLLPTWDRFLWPLPFSKSYFWVGEPIKIDEEANLAQLEIYRNDVENSLNYMTRKSDEKMGITPVEPA